MRWIGFGLFLISFVVPARVEELQFFAGSIVFVQTPMIAVNFFGEKDYLLAAVTFAAWLANLSVAVPRVKWVAVLAILSVWVAYGCFFEMLRGFIPFYPWGIGITVVQIANLLRAEWEGADRAGRNALS
jgi:hypothetical protein